MKVILSPRAEKQLKKFSKIGQIAIAKKIRAISQTQSLDQEKKLSGLSNIYRIRVGDYRIVYKRTKQEIYIVLIGQRQDIYKLVRQLIG
jgi:mRNA interferase RelE/StbE